VAVLNLYSKRRKAELKVGQADVFQYDTVPPGLRAQVVHIWRDALGRANQDAAFERWQVIHYLAAREAGVMTLVKYVSNPQEACEEWFLDVASDEAALDMIDLTFMVIYRSVGKLDQLDRSRHGITVSAADAIDELNKRFREHSLGFQHENGQLIRMDNQYVHAEVIRPALALLSGKPFQTANDDFLTAHKHYREGHYKDCVVACQRAFESTLKAICSTRGWAFAKADRVSELITTVRKHGLFPDYLNKGLDAYIAMLKTGLPGVRNNAGGHGDEPSALPVPDYIAAHALHLSAANIVVTVEAFKALKANP
jgi:Domain of unknown function (DUF7014)/AbiJ N-terminal domain 4/HEPN domain